MRAATDTPNPGLEREEWVNMAPFHDRDGSPEEPLLTTLEDPLLDSPAEEDALLAKKKKSTRQRLWESKRIRAFVCGILFVLAVLAIGLLTHHGLAPKTPYSRLPEPPLKVTLPGYGTFRGTQVLTTLGPHYPLQAPVDAFLGVEYATQPVNESRFAPVTWPDPFEGTRNATEYGPSCVQKYSGQENCLVFNLYRTSGIPYDRKLPVFVFLHGGSFVVGHGRSFDGASFVNRSSAPLIVVTAQYRLGSLGSLPSQAFEEEGLLNLGLRDQRMMLEFMQKYVSEFGGDPDRITLGGQSAGGHSVGIHLFHNYGEDKGKKLFSQAILASGSPMARSFPNATYPWYQEYLQRYADYLFCDTSPNSAFLDCIKDADVKSIKYIQALEYDMTKQTGDWPWQPVSPGPFFEKRGSQSGIEGTIFDIPVLISSTTDEGSFFAPQNLSTNEDFLHHFRRVGPELTDQDIQDLEKLYPDPDPASANSSTAALSARKTQKYHGTGPYAPDADSKSMQWKRISAAYGDYSYICPIQETAYRLYQHNTSPVYKARFNTPNYAPKWKGIPHASDAAYFNGNHDVEFPDVMDVYHSYYASFVVSGDPNKYAADDAPAWDPYKGPGSKVLAVGNKERGGIKMEDEGRGIRMKECRWWRDVKRMRRLNK